MGNKAGRNGFRKDLAAAMVVLVSGCTGSVDIPVGGGPAPNATGTGGAMGPGPVTGSGGVVGQPPPPAGTGGRMGPGPDGKLPGLWDNVAPSATVDPERAVLRRLNSAEYDNTTRDLLGTMTKPSQKYMFPKDEVNELYDTNGRTLVYSDLLFSQVHASATGLIDELLARPATDPIRTRVLPCMPTVATMATCMPMILKPFMANAFRRPVTDAEVAQVVTLATTIATGNNDAIPGLRGALQSVLISPLFLFRIETSAAPTSSALVKVTDYELATRLSYFIGSTMPDAALTQAAAMGKLAPASADYTAQVDRLIADPTRLQAFVENFGGRWLSTRDASLVAPDEEMFKGVFDDALRVAIPQETNLFFGALLKDKMPLMTLLTANFTYANARLAQHYGAPPPTGTAFAKVSLAGNAQRMGYLTQETFLTTSSLSNRTSPIKRGVWILEQLLCDGTPAPPPGIPDLPENGTGTARQILETHRKQAACAYCHDSIDPIGVALENYDAIGAYRTKENGVDIDVSAKMSDGTTFSGAIELSNLLAKDPRVTWCMTKQAMTYAVGRSFEAPAGRAYIKSVAAPLMNANATWPDLIKAVATSEAFRTSRGEGP